MDFFRMISIWVFVAIVGIGPMVLTLMRRRRDPGFQLAYREHHNPLALARLQFRRGQITEEEYRNLERELVGMSAPDMGVR